MKRIPGIPRESQKTRGTSRAPFGLAPGFPGDAARTLQPWTPTNHKNMDISTTVQRQKLLIAAFKSFRCNASPKRAQGPPRQP